MSREELDAVARAPRIRDRPEAARKIDMTLWKVVRLVELAAEGKPSNRAFRIHGVPDGCIPAQIEIVIQHTGPNEQAFIDLGFREISHAQGGGFTTGSISPARLADLASLPHVVFVIGPTPIWFELNDSIESVRVDQIRRADPAATGAGTVVGIIDSGIDWKHGSFCRPDGSTRILGIWDQERKAIAGETAGPASSGGGQGRGTVYTRDDIDHSLGKAVTGPAVKVRHRDTAADESVNPFGQTTATRNKLDPDEKRPHGTHVAGIAAGDGSPGSCCRPGGFRFVGMAPAAELLVVAVNRLVGDNAALVTAFDWIESHPRVAGKPIVVNISAGFNLGAHDGSHTLEKRIERFLQPVPDQPTRVVVKSAGNEAATNRHLHATVPDDGQLSVPLVVTKGGGEGKLEIWVPHGSGLEIQFRAGSAATERIPLTEFLVEGPVSLPSAGATSEQTTIFFQIFPAHPNNGQDVVFLEVSERGEFASESVRIDIFNPTATPVTFDAWIEKNGTDGLQFHAHDDSTKPVRATPDGTLTIPGTATNVISVANGRSNLVAQSSRGPVRGAAPSDRSKPTVTANGAGVTSAEAGGRHWCACLCGGPWTTMNGGTSMSAPHVTGIVALMLQKNPTLPLADIHAILRGNTIEGDHGDPNGWGAGRVDGFAAWQAVSPPPAPSALHSPGSSLAIASTAVRTPAAPPIDPTVMFHPVVALARSSPELAEIAALFSRHLSEVRRLINTNRRVATLWHRGDGPQLLRRLGLGTTDPAAPSPLRHRADRDYIARMFDQLVRYGSPRLAASIRSHGPRVLALLETPLAAHG